MAAMTQRECSGLVLVFGLAWEPVIGGDGRAQALGASRRAGSTHMVFPGGVMAAVGHGSPGGGARRGMAMHSAAQCVASLHAAGSVLLMAPIENMGVWTVACHEGTVVSRTDCFCDSAAQAGRIADELRQVYAQLQVIDALADPSMFSLEVLAGQAGRHSQLERIASLRNLAAGRWRWLLPALLVPGLLYPAWRDEAVPDMSGPASEANAHVLWRDATERQLAARQTGTVAGEALLRSVYAVPVGIGGWSLLHVICQAEGARWNCQAVYVRGQAGADNEAFFREIPSGWKVQVMALDQIRVRWHVSHRDAPLRLDVLQGRETTDRSLLSALQHIEPAFERVSVGQPEAMTVVLPDTDGAAAIARPPSVPRVARRPLQLSGPLRSAALLLAHAQPISLSRIELAHRSEAVAALRDSRLNIVLTGDIHETM